MTPHVIIIDGEVVDRCGAVKQHALLHRQTIHDIVRCMGNPDLAIGNDPNFVVEIHDGWRLVYSVEQQPDLIGWCEHLSVSLQPKGEKPIEPSLTIVRRMMLPLFELHRDNLIKQWAEQQLDGDKLIIGNLLFKFAGKLP